MLPGTAIRGSVGTGGKNSLADVLAVQLLLNAWLRAAGQPLLALDGVAGPLTCHAVKSCQSALGMPVLDGRVDPGGPTLKVLTRLCLGEMSLGFQPNPYFSSPAPAGAGDLPFPDIAAALSAVLGQAQAAGPNAAR